MKRVREDAGMMMGGSMVPVIIEHGAPKISLKWISVRFVVRGVVRWRERRQCVVVKYTEEGWSRMTTATHELWKRRHDDNKYWA
jgi:hypothetical protein